MKELLEHLVTSLVDAPEQVAIVETHQEGVDSFKILVAPQDRGKVIGRNGRIIVAIRTISTAVARQAGNRATMKI